MYDAPDCAFHANQVLTNFCLNKECWLPLCPECIQIHLEEHRESRTESKIATLENVRYDILQNVSKASTSYKDLHANFQNQRKAEITKETKLFDKLDLAKQKVLNIVENYFNSLKTDIREFHSSSKLNRNNHFSRINNTIDERIREIETYMQKLTSENFVKYIVMLHSKNCFHEFDVELLNLKRELDHSNVSLPEILLDETALHGLNIELARFINFSRKELPINQQVHFSPEKRNIHYQKGIAPLNFTPPRGSLHIPNEFPPNQVIEYRSLTPDRVTIYPNRKTPVKYCNEIRLPHNVQTLNPAPLLDHGIITKMAAGASPSHLFRHSGKKINPSHSHFPLKHPKIVVEGQTNNSKSINIGEVIKDHKAMNHTRSLSQMNRSKISNDNSVRNDDSRLQKVDRVSLVNNSKLDNNSRNQL